MFKRKVLKKAEWYDLDVDNGYCTQMLCDTREGVGAFMSDEEALRWEEGHDDCYWIVKLIEMN